MSSNIDFFASEVVLMPGTFPPKIVHLHRAAGGGAGVSYPQQPSLAVVDTLKKAPVGGLSYKMVGSGQVQFVPYDKTADSYYWDFGDGNSSILKQPFHKYSASGTYTVTLAVSNTQATPVVSQQTITFVISPPRADFSMSVLGKTVRFFNLSTVFAASVQWQFSDGATSSADSPFHTFPENGTYTAMLIITLSNGVKYSRFRSFTVQAGEATVFDTFTGNDGDSLLYDHMPEIGGNWYKRGVEVFIYGNKATRP